MYKFYLSQTTVQHHIMTECILARKVFFFLFFFFWVLNQFFYPSFIFHKIKTLRKVVVFYSVCLLMGGRDVFFVSKEKKVRLIACIPRGSSFIFIYTCFVLHVRICPVSKHWITGYWNSRIFTGLTIIIH